MTGSFVEATREEKIEVFKEDPEEENGLPLTAEDPACSEADMGHASTSTTVKANATFTVKCPKCPKVLTSLKAMYGHQKKHRGDRNIATNLSCEKCNITMESVGHYSCHNAIMHTPTFRCKRCPSSGFAPAELVCHVLDHEGFEEARKRVYNEIERKN